MEALRHGTGDVIRMQQYQKRRDFIVRRFNEMGLDCHSPRGSFYAFPSVESLGLKRLISVIACRERKLRWSPVRLFGEHGKHHVRASFSTSYDKLVGG